MSSKIGADAKLYYSTTALDDSTNTPGSVSWMEITNCRDVTTSLERGEADTSTRGNNGWRTTKGTLKDGTLEFEMVWDTEDDAFGEIRDAYMNNTEIALAAMSGDVDTSGEEGLASNFTITNFSRSEPLEDAMTVSVTARPSSQTEWYEVGGS